MSANPEHTRDRWRENSGDRCQQWFGLPKCSYLLHPLSCAGPCFNLAADKGHRRREGGRVNVVGAVAPRQVYTSG